MDKKAPEVNEKVSAESIKIDEVFERIYRKYGANLSAFFRDAKNEVRQKREKLEKASTANAEANPFC